MIRVLWQHGSRFEETDFEADNFTVLPNGALEVKEGERVCAFSERSWLFVQTKTGAEPVK